MANERDIAFAREILRTVLGLDKQTIDNVIREIRATADVSAIKTTMIRQRIGAHSLRLLRNGIDAAKETAKQTGDEDEFDDEEEDQVGDTRSSAEDEKAKQQGNNAAGSAMNRPGAAAPVRAESVNEAKSFPITVTVKFESLPAARTAHESMSGKYAKGVEPAAFSSLTKDNSFKVTVQNQTGYQKLKEITKNYRGTVQEPTNESGPLREQTEYTAIGYFDQKQDSKPQRRKITAGSPEEAAKQMQAKMKKLAKERKGSQKHSKATRVLDPSGKEVWNHKNNKLSESKSRGEFDILKEFMVDIDPNDEEAPMRVRRMITQAQQAGGEERLLRQLVQQADQDRDEGRRNGNKPVDNIDQQINRLKYQLALLQRRRASLARRENEKQQNGTREKQQQDERQ